MIRTTAAAVLAALLLAACGNTQIGVAAKVGDHTIETSAFAARVARSYENEAFAQQNPKDVYQRTLLQSEIITHLVKIAAQRLGVVVTDAQVKAREAEIVQLYGGQEQYAQRLPALGYHLDDMPTVIRGLVTDEAVMDKLVENEVTTQAQLEAEYQRQLPQYDRAHIAHILVRDKALAERVAKDAKAPGADFAALAKRHSQDTDTRENGGDLGVIGNGEGRFSKAFEQAVFAARQGDVVGPIRTVTGGDAKIVGYEIVKIVERRTQTFTEVRDDLRRALLEKPRTERFNTYVGNLAKEFGVSVNPRFGTWDAQRLGIVASDDTVLSSPAPVPGEEVPAGVVPGPVGTPPPTGGP